MSVTELRGWLAYTRDHPLPEPWVINGILCQLLSALHSRKSKVTDYIPVVPQAGSKRKTGIDWAAVATLKKRSQDLKSKT